MTTISASIARRALALLFDAAGIALVILMLATVTDIVARQLGLFSVRGIVELSIISVILIGFMALPNSLVLGGHIVIDLATLWLPVPVTRMIDAAWLCIAAGGLAFLAWQMWITVIDVYARNERSLDLQLPTVAFWLPAALGLTLAPVACLIAAFVGRLKAKDESEQRIDRVS